MPIIGGNRSKTSFLAKKNHSHRVCNYTPPKRLDRFKWNCVICIIGRSENGTLTIRHTAYLPSVKSSREIVLTHIDIVNSTDLSWVPYKLGLYTRKIKYSDSDF